MSRQRRIGIWVWAFGVLIGASVGYALEGVGLAIFEAVALAVVGALALKFAPELLPPPPEAVPRPAVGRSPAATRRRRTEGFAVLASGLPVVLAAGILASDCPAGSVSWPPSVSRPLRSSRSGRPS